MQPHEERVVQEYKELDTKIIRLSGFLNSQQSATLHPIDRDLLSKQFSVMREYRSVLQERIKRFGVQS